ncbi:hypothetical protein B2K_19375 [Paenibacillus mucilaginosus K02]|uniref:Uncharacterized protein n=1 Tax=Paenibacillus mucilaginosus K02 TaxID=997761 RepID=I0BKF1_9BACL|nr:hypothetical protein B2K_19375 [Paenibacillus mucilaginosus K02]
MDFIKFPMMFLGLSIALQIPAVIKEHNPASSPQGIIKVRPPDQYANPIVIPSVPIGLPVLSDPSSKIKLTQKKRLKSHSLEELKALGLMHLISIFLQICQVAMVHRLLMPLIQVSISSIQTRNKPGCRSHKCSFRKKMSVWKRCPSSLKKMQKVAEGRPKANGGRSSGADTMVGFFYFGIRRMFDTRLAHLLSQTGLM